MIKAEQTTISIPNCQRRLTYLKFRKADMGEENQTNKLTKARYITNQYHTIVINIFPTIGTWLAWLFFEKTYQVGKCISSLASFAFFQRKQAVCISGDHYLRR